MAKRPITIPDSELEVLKSLWERGVATVHESLATLQAAGSRWSYSTVSVLLSRLEAKGLVECDRSELAYVYRPTIGPQEVRRRRIVSLVDKLFQGKAGLLVLHLIKSQPIDADSAREARDILDQMCAGDSSAPAEYGRADLA